MIKGRRGRSRRSWIEEEKIATEAKGIKGEKASAISTYKKKIGKVDTQKEKD